MKSALWITSFCLCLSASPLRADMLFGVYAGAGTWQQEFSGDVTSGAIVVDVDEDLGLEDDNTNLFYVAVEHGVPVLPNIRAQHFAIDINAANVLSRTIEFNGETFFIADALNTNVELSQTDAVLYYELMDNVVSFDLGVALSHMDGTIEVAGTNDTSVADFDEIIPMVYTRFRTDLPLTGLWLGAEGQGVSYDGHSLLELNAQIGWESDTGFGLEAGWRTVSLELDTFDSVDNADFEVEGPYASLNYHF